MIASVLGPLLTILSHVMMPGYKFVGLILLLTLLVTGSIGLLWTVKFPRLDAATMKAIAAAKAAGVAEQVEPPRPLRVIVSSKPFVMAFFLMSMATMIMIAYMAVLPLVMTQYFNYSYGVMSVVMMVHMLGMTVTSYVTGPLIFMVGLKPMVVLGLAFYLVSWACFFSSYGHVAGFVLGACWLGVGWNFLSNCAALIVLGTTKPNEDAKRAQVQSVFDFWNYFTCALIVFLVADMYFYEGWEGVLYTALIMILMMVLGAVYVQVRGWDEELELDKLYEGSKDATRQMGHEDVDGALEDCPSSMEMARPSFHSSQTLLDTILNPMARSLDEGYDSRKKGGPPSGPRNGTHPTMPKDGIQRSRADSGGEEYSSMAENAESVRTEYRNSKTFRASFAAQFSPARLPGEKDEESEESSGSKKKVSFSGGDVELGDMTPKEEHGTPKAYHSSSSSSRENSQDAL